MLVYCQVCQVWHLDNRPCADVKAELARWAEAREQRAAARKAAKAEVTREAVNA